MLITVLGPLLDRPATAQTFRFLHYTSTGTGGGPIPSSLVLSGNTLYGTTSAYSIYSGTVFALNTDGTGFTNLYSFSAVDPPANYNTGTNSDGANPGSLILSGNALYGTTSREGISGNGTVVAVHTDGTGFTNLHSFTALSNGDYGTNSDGANPVVVNGQNTVTNPISGTQQFSG